VVAKEDGGEGSQDLEIRVPWRDEGNRLPTQLESLIEVLGFEVESFR
jgi:hypothetical protein